MSKPTIVFGNRINSGGAVVEGPTTTDTAGLRNKTACRAVLAASQVVSTD